VAMLVELDPAAAAQLVARPAPLALGSLLGAARRA
jgi:hypothetical protein